MANATDEIRLIVEQVLKSSDIAALLAGSADGTPAVPGPAGSADAALGAPLGNGVFPSIDAAVSAAGTARRELGALPLETRRRMIEAMRNVVLSFNESLAQDALSETGPCNVRDKQAKNALAALKTPGVKDVEPSAYSDEHGLTITKRARKSLLAVDGVQAGIGDLVLVVDEGGSARTVIGDERLVTIRTAIRGIVDRVDIEDESERRAE